MILQGTASHLNPNFASPGHKDWNARFAAIPESDKLKDNEQMKEIFELLLLHSASPLSADKMAACVNNEPTTMFLGIDAADPDNFVMFHNLEVIPASRHQHKPIIRALHGFGKQATVVILNYENISKLNEIACTSMTNIRKFAGLDHITTSMTSSNAASKLKCRSLIALPPFISSKLMNLPDLAVTHVVAIVLKTISDYDRKLADKLKRATIDLSDEKEEKEKEEEEDKDDKEEKEVKEEKEEAGEKEVSTAAAPPKELTEDPIQNDSDEEAGKTAEQGIQRKPTETIPATEAPIPRKAPKPSSYAKCESLLKFIWKAAWQLRFPTGNDTINGPAKPMVPGVSVALTTDQAHLAWGKERHTRNGVGLQNPTSPAVAASSTPPTALSSPESLHLARKTTTALETMSACFQVLQTNAGTTTTSVEKVHPINMRMIKRLCSVDGMTEREPTKFFTELSTATGKGGTGAIIRWGLHMSLQGWNVRVSNGCVVALSKGIWCWDRQNFPNNCTIFSFPRVTANDYAKGVGESSQNIHLRANCGSNLSEKDVKLLTHQGMSYTPDVAETIKQLRNFSRCLDAMIHPDSMMATNLKGFIKMIEDNEESYEANQAMDSLFCLKLLYKTDLTRNRLFQACLVNEDFVDVDWNMCDFYRIHASVMDGNFFQNLPANLGVPDSTANPNKRGKQSEPDDSSDQPSKRKKVKGIREGQEKGNQVINTDQPDSLKLQTGEDYHNMITVKGQLQSAPKWTNSTKTICANWHIIGRCHSRCLRAESHKKLSNTLIKETETWLKKCRDLN